MNPRGSHLLGFASCDGKRYDVAIETPKTSARSTGPFGNGCSQPFDVNISQCFCVCMYKHPLFEFPQILSVTSSINMNEN